MAIQMLAGLPMVVGAITGWIASAASLVTSYLTMRLALVLVAFAIIGTLTIAFFALVDSSMRILLLASPPELSAGFALLMPSNLSHVEVADGH